MIKKYNILKYKIYNNSLKLICNVRKIYSKMFGIRIYFIHSILNIL